MTTEATTFIGHIQEPEAGYKTYARPESPRRFRSFIEQTDWDEVILAHDEWIDRLCIGIIIVASLYFIPPVLVMLFLG